ncbi:replication protein P [Haliea sp. E17]|uniref:replication protein P n=1 Tax=Haliea sp. E17 TaxID=3401576 RepID=UPI003AAD8815
MPDSRDLIQQVGREIAASKTTSATPAGPTEKASAPPEGHVEAINQVFALFRLNYHNQYYAAYPDQTQLNQIKKLWLDALADLPVEQILHGAKHAIENSEYLPTLNRMLECCAAGLSAFGLPAPRDAYLEACNAASPKSAQPWSHPAVYLAGRDSDWFFLSSEPENRTWPVFRERYQHWCNAVLRGEKLAVPAPEALEQQAGTPMTPDEQHSALAALRRDTGL